jgi:predicted Holliday junction resolvase-like endonuclease
MYLLDLLIPENWLMAMGVAILFLIWLIIDAFLGVKRKFRKKYNDLELIAQRNEAQIELFAQERTTVKFEDWKKKELIAQIQVITQQVTAQAKMDLEVWKISEIKLARQDSRKRSVRSVLGKIAEFLIPFSAYLEQYNPKDMRFIGSPIDFIIFDGIEEEREDVKIIFVEVKTGTSALTKRQKAIRKAIDEKNIGWIPVSLKDIKDQLQNDEE